MNALNRLKMYLWASALVLFGLYGTAANAVSVHNYTATIATVPVTVDAGKTGIYFTVTITNDGTTSNQQTIKSAKVQMPAGFSNLTYIGKSANISGWTYDGTDPTTITVTKSGSQVVARTESLEIYFYVDAGCTAGDYTWNTYAYGADDAAGTPYAIVGDQPSVTISGTCDVFTGWESGDYCSVGQGGWGADAHGNNPGAMRDAYFASVYPSGVTVGPGTGYYSLNLTTEEAVNAYLPAGGKPGPLDQDYTDPTSTLAGEFGGQVLSLKLNVDFNNAGHLGDFVNFGTVMLHDTGTALDGLSIGYILLTAESVLGGDDLPNGVDLDLLNHYVDAINNAYPGCEPSDFAQAHLMPGS